ncbi:carbonic anhydrase [Rhodococcus sp. 14-2470-1a]|uniref:carbonic anhydrase n=1 Tax=Rhodococcus sp. 14-2470-1a TaxID=2023150 RepID=UPI0015C6135F|nr:carbonic anhydrase family protein [Rhodococcus sp. 14-2470-1a]
MLTTALTLALCAGTPLLTSSAAATPVQSDQPHWSYEDPDGPADWAGLSPTFGECSTGQNQSPIDLPDVVPDGGDDVGVATEAVRGPVTDTGHTTQVSPQVGGTRIDYEGNSYQLQQLHVHSPSEHTIDGKSFDAEIHFVHANAAGKLLVLGIFADKGLPADGLQPFVDAIAADAETVVDLDLDAVLPDSLDHYAYEGSLTTPPCTENVQWIVLSTPISMSDRQLDVLAEDHLENSRPTMPLGNRIVTGGVGSSR